MAAPPAISCPGFFHTWSFLRVPPLGLLRRSPEPHTHSKIYSNESLMTLEGNQQAQEGLQRFSFKTQRFFFLFPSPSLENKLGQGGRLVHTECSSGNTQGSCTCSGMLRDAAPQGCWQNPLPSRLGPQGLGEEGMGRRTGQREAATSGLFAAIQKPREIGSLFH